MALYIDSSFLLAILLEKKKERSYIRAWKKIRPRVASISLEAECVVTLRRTHRHSSRHLPSDWLQRKEAQLKELLAEVSLRTVDRAIIRQIRTKKDLCECRTLDALHLATALEFKKNSDESIAIGTLDQEMRKLSEKLGFGVYPEA